MTTINSDNLAARPAPPATILAVDDTSESLALLVKILTEAGYDVRPADSGELALAAVAVREPDLILLDVRMPGIDGLEVCRRFKARDQTRHIPIILISAFADVKEAVAGLQQGAADYIAKPFQPEELLARVKTHLSLSRANTALEQQAVALRQTNEQLQTEIVERRRVEDELRLSLARAERSRQAMLDSFEDQKRSQEALCESEELYRRLAEDMPAYITAYLPDGTMTYANAALAEMAGIPREALVGRNFLDLVPPAESELVKKYLRALSPEHPTKTYEQSYRTPDGSERVQLWINRAFFDERGQPAHFQGIGQDITARKMAEEQMQAQLDELHRWQAVMLGRADRNMKLKRDVNELLRRLGEPIRYPSQAEGSEQ